MPSTAGSDDLLELRARFVEPLLGDQQHHVELEQLVVPVQKAPVRDGVEDAHADHVALCFLALDTDDRGGEAHHLARLGHLLLQGEPELLERRDRRQGLPPHAGPCEVFAGECAHREVGTGEQELGDLRHEVRRETFLLLGLDEQQ